MKSKYLIIGDLHCRSIWKDIVTKEWESYDKIIFLGDYVPPRHDVQLDDPTDACGFLYEVLEYKDQNPDKVILLRGNHDMQALGYYWAECYPKVHPKVAAYCRTDDIKNWFLNNTQWIYQIPNTNIVCSHAGISEKFLDNICKYFKSQDGWDFNIYDQDELINHINDIPPCELFGFTPCKLSDYTGESSTQPCTWIRPYTLLHYGIKNIIHIVGHTPVKNICNIKEESLKLREKYDITEAEDIVKDYCDIWCCDNLQNNEYLVIEDGEFKSCKL